MNTGLLNSTLFTTIICLVLIFALLSLLISTLTEAINSYFQERGRLLFRTIGKLFEDGINVNFGQLLYNHPMVDSLKKDPHSLPQYISAETFSNALIDVVANYAREYQFDATRNEMAPLADTRSAFDRFQAGVDKMHHTPLKLLLLNMLDKARQDPGGHPFAGLQLALEQWYNDQMQRVTGWYKTWIRTRLFWIALVVAMGLNVDSIHLFQTIYRSPDLRARLEPIAQQVAANYGALAGDTTLTPVQRARKAVDLTTFPRDSLHTDSFFRRINQAIDGLQRVDSLLKVHDSIRQATFREAQQQIDDIATLGLPVGWHRNAAPVSWFTHPATRETGYFKQHLQGTGWNIFLYILGIFITAFSLSAGAPFWFDVLLRLVNVRRTGTKPNDNKK